MHISQISAGILCLTAFAVAGPLPRNGAGRLAFRKVENSTNTAVSAPADAVTIVPVPFSSSLSLQIEGSTTISHTELIPLAGSSSLELSIGPTSTLIQSSIPTTSSPSPLLSSISPVGSLSSPVSTTTSEASATTALTNPSSAIATTAINLSSTPASISGSASTSFSREFSLVTSTTSAGSANTVAPTSPLSLITNTFSATDVASTNTAAAGANTVLTINVSSLLSSEITPSQSASITLVSESKVPQIITTSAPAVGTISPQTSADNLAQAKGFNNLFSSLTPDSACTAGQIACIDSKTATCGADGKYSLAECAAGSSCFALPMNTTAGVYVGCQDVDTANAALGIENGAATTSIAAASTPAQLQSTVILTDISLTLPTASPGVNVPPTSTPSLNSAAITAPAVSTTNKGAQSTIALTDKSLTLPTASPGVIISSAPASAAGAASVVGTTPAAVTSPSQGAQDVTTLTDPTLGLTLTLTAAGVTAASQGPLTTTIILTDQSLTLPTASPGVIISSTSTVVVAPAATPPLSITSAAATQSTIILTDQSLTLPTASPGVIVSSTHPPAAEVAPKITSTKTLHSTETQVVYVTAPSPVPAAASPQAQKASPTSQAPAPESSPAGSLVTIVPIVPGEAQAVAKDTVTVTMTERLSFTETVRTIETVTVGT